MLEPNFTPFPELHTERLLLNQEQKKDAPEILWLRSDEKVMQYIDKDRTTTIEEAENLIEQRKNDVFNGNGINWGIRLKENPGKMIGSIGLWRMIKPHYRAEVGYMLHHTYWGKGIMNEALLAVIDFGFQQVKLHSIEAHINPANAASAGILEKTGFVREAYFKEDFYFRGQFLDTAVYSLLNKK